MTESTHWYDIRNTDQVDTPALIIYPQRVKENIGMLKMMIDDPRRLRPHVKTHKTKEATLLMMEAGINKFKCATIAEAEMLGMCRAGDVLLAYQPYGPRLHRFVALIKQYPDTRFSCLTDNLAVAQQISAAAIRNDMIIPVYIDLNTGMNRTGIKPDEKAIQLYEDGTALKGIRMMGLHAYDGHIRNKEVKERARACNADFAPVLMMRKTLMEKGYVEPRLIAGGTPTFPVYAAYSHVECSPGTFIYWDKGYQDACPEQKFLPAALVITRVVSLPGETTLCVDMGYKSIASENEPANRVYFLNAPGLTVVSQSEEHMVLEAGKQHAWKIGDLLYGLPVHICPSCALYDAAITVEKGDVTGAWEIISRKRKITI